MESWKSGRRDLFDQLTKVCNRFGEDLEAELNNENDARVSREELHLLRENSRQVEQLAEHNARLVDELERCREISSRVAGLEKENKRLAGELGQKWKLQQEIGIPKPVPQISAVSKATPGSSEPYPSSANRTDPDGSVWVPRAKHQALIAKFNTTCEAYENCKDAKKKLNEMLEAEKEKNRKWVTWNKGMENASDQRNQKIRRLEEEVQRLRARPKDQRESLMPSMSRTSFEVAGAIGEEPISGPSLLQNDKDEVDVPDRDPIDHSRMDAVDGAERVEHASDIADGHLRLVPPIFEDSGGEEPELPIVRAFNDAHREAIGQEAVDTHHTSSTEEFDPLTPHKDVAKLGNANPGNEKELEIQPPIEEPDSPELYFVSARSVKKRKFGKNTQPTIKTQIKVETISSSPISVFRSQDPNESLDLDDIGEKVDTPKKQRRPHDLSQHVFRPNPISQEAARLKRVKSRLRQRRDATDGDEESTQDTPVRRTNSILQPRSTNRQILPRTSDVRAPKKRRIASDEAVGELIEDGEIEAASPISRRPTSDTNGRLDVLLSKPSPPKLALSPARMSRSGNQQIRSARTPATSGLAREYEVASEQPKRHFQRVAHTSTGGSGQASEEASRPSSKSSSLQESAEPSRPNSKGSSRASMEPARPASKGRSAASVEITRPSAAITTPLSALQGTPGLTSRRIQLFVDSGFETVESILYTPSKMLSSIGGVSEHEVAKIRAEAKKLHSTGYTPGSRYFPDITRTPLISAETPSHLPPRRLPLAATISSKKAVARTIETPKALTRTPAMINQKSLLKRPRSEVSGSDWEMDPDQEPLRARPIKHLTLSDFKINPNYNQGQKHMFTEVVRGQEARSCLQGCTKPECCGGKFRALARSNRNPAIPRTAAQEEEDNMLLDEFLGDNAYKRQHLGREEREELIIQAKTRELANKYGRHRHVYERRTSPPGFWRADFPTTQEEEEDREKAREMERDTVAERYREAMRPGGRFMFRDE